MKVASHATAPSRHMRLRVVIHLWMLLAMSSTSRAGSGSANSAALSWWHVARTCSRSISPLSGVLSGSLRTYR